MPSSLHEALIEIFRQRPSLAAELLDDVLGMRVPAHEQARAEPGDLNDLAPTEYRADAVVVPTAAQTTTAQTPVLGVVVEVQLRRDQDKRWSWPVYLATLRARLRCPTVLLVVCVDAAVAAWCAAPVELGHPGSRLTPLVLGPHQVPVVTDPAAAVAVPELSVLSAMAHGARPDRHDVLDALLSALASIDPDRALLYSDVVLAALPTAAQRYLEALMTTGTYEYQSEFARRHRAQGRAEGKAEGEANAVLAVLEARGLAVSDAARARVGECTDLDQLDVWVRRAAIASSADDLFA
ncbi:MAG: hypothetical protein L0H64_02985 [Pseudonocardia sp.]|nr:hypothetical protein [Pseudonocardia sp.]